jgi:hypothetical protein
MEKLPEVERFMRNTGCRMQGARCKVQDAGYQIPDAGCRVIYLKLQINKLERFRRFTV